MCRTMSAEKDAYRDGKTNFTLRCGADHNGAWRCETEVEVREYQENGINFDVACTEVSILRFDPKQRKSHHNRI